jgi:hypothetical protein
VQHVLVKHVKSYEHGVRNTGHDEHRPAVQHTHDRAIVGVPLAEALESGVVFSKPAYITRALIGHGIIMLFRITLDMFLKLEKMGTHCDQADNLERFAQSYVIGQERAARPLKAPINAKKLVRM